MGSLSDGLGSGGTEKDGQGDENEVDGTYPEAETVDDHGGELPIVALIVLTVVHFQLIRQVAELAEYGQHRGLEGRHLRLPLGTRPARRPVLMLVMGRSDHVDVGVAVDVAVKDVGDEALRRRSRLLEQAEAGLALPRGRGEVMTRTGDAQ